jgi:phage protein U
MLMALGQFVFQLPTLAYHELQRSTEWRHAANSRVGARDALQFIGPGEDTITLSGTLVPEIAGTLDSLRQLRAMAEAGDAYALVDGTGRVMGAWVITSLNETGSAFVDVGVARKTDFTLTLKHADDDQVQAAGGSGAMRGDIATVDTNGGRMDGFA